MMNLPRVSWTIVDRPAEGRAADDALTAPGTAVLFDGAGGVGKSTLARGVIARRGTATTIVGLHELSQVPLAALAAAVPRLGGVAVEERFAHAVDALSAAGEEALILVDDAALLDQLSAAAVHQAVRGAGARAILTARTGATLPAPLERLRHEGTLTTIRVDPFGIDAIEHLVRSAIGVPPDPGTVAALSRITHGNPMFLRALVEQAHRAGQIRVENGSASIELGALPENLVDVVSEMLSALDREERDALTTVVYSEPVAAALVGADDAIARLIAHGLLRSEDGVLRVAHPILREAVRARIPPSRHRQLTLDAALRLRADGDEEARIRRIALLIEAGEPVAPEQLCDAAELANSYQDHRLAARLGKLAAEAGGSRGTLAWAVALSGLGDDVAAEDAYCAAREQAETPEAAARVASRAAHHAALRGGDPARAVRIIETALAQIDPQDAATAALAADVVKWRAMAGGSLAAPALADPRHEEPPALAGMLMTAMVQSMGGRVAEARATIAAARPMAQAVRVDEPFADVLLDLDEYLARVFDGELAAAAAFAQQRADPESPHTLGLWTYVLALQHQHLGNLTRARSLADTAVRSLRWFDFTGLVGPAEALLATTAARMGETARAESLLDEMDPARFSDIKVVLQAAEARSWLLFARGRTEAAARTVSEAAELGVERGHPALAALTAFVALAQGESHRVVDVLERIADLSDARLIHVHARHARAAVDRDPRTLDAVAGDYVAMAHPYGAAIALTEAARGWERAGTRERARASRRQLALLGAVEGLPAGDASVVRLTSRETEVALAAARRQRSREIADAWGVSVRTVEHQLSAVYRKLGVSSRDELRSALRSAGVLAAEEDGELRTTSP